MKESRPLSHPSGLLVDLHKPLTFHFNGRAISAFAGQTVAAALYASGQRIFTRSFKYHRPRGLFCVSGDCPNCLMQVDGQPNVRTCIEPVRQGQVVCHQNAWPTLGWDVLRIFDRLDRFLPVGFYYKRFHKPRWLWPLFERVVRHIAGLGRIDIHKEPKWTAGIEHLHAEVCVVGGGPAGMAAAGSAAAAGADVLLLERHSFLGGHTFGKPSAQVVNDSPAAEASLRNHPRVQVLVGTTVFGLYEGNLLGAFAAEKFLKIRAKQIIICTGGREQPFLFHNNDLPGIFLGRGALRLAHLYGVLPGKRSVVLTNNDEGHRLATQLANQGIEIAAVLDRRPKRLQPGGEETWPVLLSSVALQARGYSRLKAVRVARVDEKGTVEQGSEQDVRCDVLCHASELTLANELLLQGGMRFRYERGRWLPDRQVPGLWAAGAAAGTFDLSAQVSEGRLCGRQAALALGYSIPDVDGRQKEQQDHLASEVEAADRNSPLQANGNGRKCFVCLCEDVTVKDINQAVAEGFDGIETLKRYTTVNMGPCQGKVCGQRAIEVCARATGREIDSVGTTTSRPPVVPVEMAVLAAGQRHQPIRRTPLHYWHQAAGATWLDAGQWKRPESYGDSVVEVRAVRQNLGLIDVSTLGKTELIGPDAALLLERIYLNRWADLKMGRVRYGAMCNEDGILFDDGIGTRLGPDHFYLTATTGNAEAVYQWLELWKATWRLDVTIINQTSALAAMNLAGPQSRAPLSQLTDLDLSPAAFPYPAMREGKVAGVECRLFRIGFVGELGYEIHCPSAHAWHLWEAICEAGKEFGLRPFGVEAQRILRLEKGHLIIGQDTDALSNPLEAGLEWLVSFDKAFFHGCEPLRRLKGREARSRLVGFHMLETNEVVPEGSQVVHQGKPVGRLTSTRYSPTLERSLGLAWVPAAKAEVGERFLVRHNGADVPAVVVSMPFYDPEGKRLKS